MEKRVLVLSPSEIIKTQVPANLLLHLCGLCSHFKISPHSSIVVYIFDKHKWLFQPQSPHSCQWEKETEIRHSPLREPITSSHFSLARISQISQTGVLSCRGSWEM